MSTTNNDIISPETLSKAGDLEIFDENEKKIKFSTLFATKQTLVIFIRHFLCGNCMVRPPSPTTMDSSPNNGGVDSRNTYAAYQAKSRPRNYPPKTSTSPSSAAAIPPS
jgi:hypothetical protein